MYPATLDLAAFRECMSQWATGVTVVTTVDSADRPTGFTASSFTALSMRPPLVLVCLDRRSSCWPAFNDGRGFAVHVLRADQRTLAERFSCPGDRFRGLECERGEFGLPVLPGVLCRLSCRTDRRVVAGDHVILIGEVRHVDIGEGRPLLYYARGYRELPARIGDI